MSFNPELGQVLLRVVQGAPPAAKGTRSVWSGVDTLQPIPNESRAVESEIREIAAMMGNRMSSYWKGPRAAELQA